MQSSDCCDICGNPAKIHIGDGGSDQYENYCLDCYNKRVAEMLGVELPDRIPQQIAFIDNAGISHTFEIEFQIFPSCKTLTATEYGETKYKTDVFGELDDDFGWMWKTLLTQIEKMLSVTYMQPDGYFAENKAMGYIDYNRERGGYDIVIDGKPYTWAELERNISTHEGYKIKIEFGDVGEDLD